MNTAERKKFKSIKARLRDMRGSSAKAIDEGKFIHVAGGFIQEAEWLAAWVERLLRYAPPDAGAEDEEAVEATA